MKKLVFTQRVDVIAQYGERRDSADQNIVRFIMACGYLPIPLCNIPEYVNCYMDAINPAGIMLTGGNDLQLYGGNAPERDCLEQLLIETALQRNIPLLGFCRGMQVIADYFGAVLVPINGHVASRHSLSGMFDREVNSFHHYGLYELSHPLEALAHSADGVIESLRHKNKAIFGIMWHPERENPFHPSDATLIKDIFQ